MKKIVVLWTKYSDCISSFLYHVAGHGYTHASLGLEEEPGVFYSFNYKGFCVETLEKHRRRGVEKSMLCEMEISEEAYQTMQEQIRQFEAHRAELSYTRIGVAFCLLRMPFRWKGHYFCSQFVADMLQSSGAVRMKKKPELYLPNQLFAELTQPGRAFRILENPV